MDLGIDVTRMMSMMSVTCIKYVSLGSQIPKMKFICKDLGWPLLGPRASPKLLGLKMILVLTMASIVNFGQQEIEACAGTPGLY